MPTLFRYLLAATAFSAAGYLGLLAWSEILYEADTRPSVAQAAALVPYNSNYLTRLASFEPARRNELLAKAVRVNPFDSTAWIQKGLNEEIRNNDSRTAEADYLEAARVDHMFVPRWTLANFYFRQGREPEFFQWATAALAMTPYSCEPIFTEMWLLAPHVFAKHVPARATALVQAISFLVKRRQYEDVPVLAKRLANAPPLDEAARHTSFEQTLGPAVDALLKGGDWRGALSAWSALAAASWIPLPTPSFERPISNGTFQTAALEHGFDWTLRSGQGFSVSVDHESLNLSLSGNQAEQLTLLQQWVPLAQGTTYRMTWKTTADRLQREPGITWHVYGPRIDLRSPEVVGAGDPEWQFTFAPASEAVLLSLEYARSPGQTRSEGSLRIEYVSMLGR